MKTINNVLVALLCLLCCTAYAQQKGQLKFTSTSPEAKQLMRDAWTAMLDAKIEYANELVAQAKEKDPGFALAYMFSFNDDEKVYRENVMKAKSLKASADEKLMIDAQLASLDKKPVTDYYAPLVKKYPSDNQLIMMAAFTYRNVDNRKGSLELLQQVVQRSPDFAPAHNLIGYAYMDNNEMDKAKVSFDKYMSLRPELANVYDSKGDYMMKAGNIEEAISLFEKSASMDPKYMAYSKTKADKAKAKLKEDKIIAELAPSFNAIIDNITARNLAGMFSGYADIPSFLVISNGKALKYNEYKGNLKSYFESIQKNTLTGDVKYQVLADDVVMADWDGAIEAWKTDGGSFKMRDFHVSSVFKKMDGAWKIVHVNESYVTE